MPSTQAIPAATTDADLYRPPTEPVLVDVPEFEFLMIDGEGDPNRKA